MIPKANVALPVRYLIFAAAAFIACVFAVGCSKKSETKAVPPPPVTVAPVAKSADDASAVQNVPAAQTAGNVPSSSSSVDQAIAESDAAFKAGAYVKAVKTVQALQRQQLPPDQAAKVQRQAAKLSKDLMSMMKSHTANAEASHAMAILMQGVHPGPPGVGGNQAQ